ncbi:MAG: UDP-glucose/GDP-mannose dehydrogenase family protein [Chthonomonas sp.]|nr:UDP-glucose/GDP-mannose dehydrogenase family protein [Chthonomonas sp.]
MQVAIVGTGYVGLPTGVVLAHIGHIVLCVDRDPAKVERIRGGSSPIHEPGTEDLLREGLANGRFTATTDLTAAVRAAEVVILAVGTPEGADGYPDMTEFENAALEVARAIDKPTLVVTKSTVPIGTGDRLQQLMLEAGVPEGQVFILSNPEFLQEGTAIKNSLQPDRVLIGGNNATAAQKLADMYAPLGAPVLITDRNSAELIKYASNCFLATKISFINAVSRLCEMTGADVGEVAKGIGMDQRINPHFLGAGLGWGGSCFPKDVSGLIKISERMGYDFGLLREVVKINDEQALSFLNRVEKRLGSLEGKTIAILGLAFKPNTDDIRDSRSLVLIEEILKRGGAVQVYDPIAMTHVQRIFPDIRYTRDAYDAVDGADALILATEWNDFRSLDLAAIAKRMKQPILFDGRRAVIRAAAEASGLEYHTIGKRTMA